MRQSLAYSVLLASLLSSVTALNYTVDAVNAHDSARRTAWDGVDHTAATAQKSVDGSHHQHSSNPGGAVTKIIRETVYIHATPTTATETETVTTGQALLPSAPTSTATKAPAHILSTVSYIYSEQSRALHLARRHADLARADLFLPLIYLPLYIISTPILYPFRVAFSLYTTFKPLILCAVGAVLAGILVGLGASGVAEVVGVKMPGWEKLAGLEQDRVDAANGVPPHQQRNRAGQAGGARRYGEASWEKRDQTSRQQKSRGMTGVTQRLASSLLSTAAGATGLKSREEEDESATPTDTGTETDAQGSLASDLDTLDTADPVDTWRRRTAALAGGNTAEDELLGKGKGKGKARAAGDGWMKGSSGSAGDEGPGVAAGAPRYRYRRPVEKDPVM